MGVSHYDRGGVHGYIRDNETGELEMLNSPRVQAAVQLKGEQFINIARDVFAVHSRHDSEPPILYPLSFTLESALKGAVRSVEVWNRDPLTALVEFGSFAGEQHTTPVLKYRVFGRTSDILEARAEE